MEVDIEATTDSFRMVAVLWRWILKRQPLFYGVDLATTDSFRMVAVLWRWILKRQPKVDGCCFMEVDIEATTDSFRMVAVLWRWILERQPIVLGWLLFYGGGY